MKPVYLSIEGVNSFRERQEIDFSALLKQGLFGIFGDTGSGKSTVLDSMTLALYGETERQGKEGFLNLLSKKAEVCYRFTMVEEGVRKTYEIVRTFKRQKSAVTHDAILKELAPVPAVLAEGARPVNQKAEELVGLKREDFQRCIALPQGEFAAFVKSARKDRLTMVERLFSLERYGKKLTDAVKADLTAAETEAAFKERELQPLEPFTLEGLAEKEAEAAAAKEQAIAAQKTRERLYAENEAVQKAVTLSEEYRMALKTRAALMKKEGEIAAAKERLTSAAKAAELLPLKRELDWFSAELQSSEGIICKQSQAVSSAEERRKATERELSALPLAALAERLKRAQDLMKEGESLKEFAKEEAEAKAQVAAAEAARKKAQAEVDRLLSSAEKKKKALAALPDYDAIYARAAAAIARGEARTALKEVADYFAERSAALSAVKRGESREFSSEVSDTPFFLHVEKEVSDRAAYYRRLLEEESTLSRKEAAALMEEVQRGKEEGKALSAALQADLLALEKMHAEVEKYATASAAAYEKQTVAAQKTADFRVRLAAVTDKKLTQYVGECQAACDHAEADRKTLSDRLLTQAQEIAAGKGKISTEQERKEKILAEKEKKQGELSAALKKVGAEDADKFFAAAMEEKERKSLTERVASYASDREAAEESCARLLKAVGTPVSKEEGENSARNYRNSLQISEDAARRAAELQKDLQNYRKTYAEKVQKSEEYGTIKGRMEKVSKFYDLLKRDRFLEFVADEYLVEITEQASVLLESLTRGRFRLSYEQEFMIADNLSGGATRQVTSLSGGETFLVSLSLALALSTAIAKNAARPVEFFFLDEGFGALDDGLVEVVLDALEGLKKEYFSVGLISHVQELKARIPVQLAVTAATEDCGTKVRVVLE